MLFSPILDEFTETKLTTNFAFGELPVGTKTVAGPEGDYCRYNEKVSWIKHFVGPLGCIKVDYIVEKECGRYTDQYRNDRGMDKCERPVIPESQPKQYEQPKYTEPPKQYEQPQSSNSKINQNDDYVIWGGLGIVGIAVLALIIKKFSKSNNTVNESYGNIPPKDDPSVDDKDDRTDIQKQIDANEEEIRKIDEEIIGNNSSSVHNTPPSIDQEDDPVSDDDYQNDEYDNSSSDEYEEDEGEQWKEDIQERISNNEEKLEELREYSQEIEDDREGGLYENMHDMYEAGRTDDEISQREERIDELNEALDDYDDAESDDEDYDEDYDDDR